ncbi:MAG: hypothetical protein Q8M92_06615 [Candidatus Subteraquimicrobiales bacterium]|nr:hypothetical protein [Candidatus Subteraquimicrobiales bacterium]
MKLLSRKVIASLIIFITATLFVWYAKITGAEWVALAIVTVVGYIAGDGIDNVVRYVKRGKGAPLASTMLAPDITLLGRLKALLSTSFLAAMSVYAVATLLMWYGKISTTEWNYVAMGTILGYDVLNPLEKFKGL